MLRSSGSFSVVSRALLVYSVAAEQEEGQHDKPITSVRTAKSICIGYGAKFSASSGADLLTREV